MGELRNQVVVITGASSGFGKGAALRFAEEGADLVLAARRKKLLKELAAECEEHGAKTLVAECDVSEPEDVEELAEKAEKEFGRIDVWVNNAGVSTFGRYDEVPMEEHEQVIRTNLLGTMYGSHEALRQFRKQGNGTLINVSSYLGEGSAPYQASYVASKHGVRGLGNALRQELIANDETDIHICTVMPTSMDTPFFEHAANHTGHPARPIPPVYDPELVVEKIVELAKEPEDEVIVGKAGKVSSVANKIARKPMQKLMAKRVHGTLMEQDQREEENSGSLFSPMEEGDELRGGWGEQGGGAAKAALVAIGAGAGLAALFMRRKKAA